MTSKAELEERCIRFNHGYPGMWLGDGYLLCRQCGIEQMLTEDKGIEWIYDYSMNDNPSGHSCDTCGEYIYEPFCLYCSKNESETIKGLVYNSSGDRCICRDCIHEGILRYREDQSVPLHQVGIQSSNRIAVDLIEPGVYEVHGTWADDRYGDPVKLYERNKAARQQRID